MARSQMQMAQTRRLYNYGLPLLRHKQCFGCCWQYLKSKLLIIKIFLHSYLSITFIVKNGKNKKILFLNAGNFVHKWFFCEQTLVSLSTAIDGNWTAIEIIFFVNCRYIAGNCCSNKKKHLLFQDKHSCTFINPYNMDSCLWKAICIRWFEDYIHSVHHIDSHFQNL